MGAKEYDTAARKRNKGMNQQENSLVHIAIEVQ